MGGGICNVELGLNVIEITVTMQVTNCHSGSFRLSSLDKPLPSARSFAFSSPITFKLKRNAISHLHGVVDLSLSAVIFIRTVRRMPQGPLTVRHFFHLHYGRRVANNSKRARKKKTSGRNVTRVCCCFEML